ncbi:AAA family ATPase [Actinokineospora globicatena]|uniref:AAA family ATPase n=1 Tax=Actinokineospora globicatena TaxID=103729 RepID=UPI0020A4ED74|nr:AAA family ATPase [Actinokineospora globicatena]MCP2302885.1 C-terminal, D2-small domain-containing protein, of ClpB protein [Actinokineospora globicatena]GLW78732.1 chaperone [Actinokineospora globicatena]GLW84600.1 chaperone [Actinokineospora globicatena]
MSTELGTRPHTVPAFAGEIAGTLAVHSQYVLHGNTRDRFLVSDGGAPQIMELVPLLWHVLRPAGFDALVTYDTVAGLGVYPATPEGHRAVDQVLGANVLGRRPSPERLRAHLTKVVGTAEQPPPETDNARPAAGAQACGAQRPAARLAFVVDHASRLVRSPTQLDQAERDQFLFFQKLALTAEAHEYPDRPRALHNPVIWLVEGERDLPVWFTAGGEAIRTVAVPMPTLDERTTMAGLLVPMLPPAHPRPGRITPAQELAGLTEGMALDSLFKIIKLALDRGLGADRVADATRIFKLGIDDNLWRRGSVREQITTGQRVIAGRVLGQERAVGKTLDILKRAALGLSGAQASTSGHRPRGVLFFAGPTGVGKTELAKQVAELLFGDAQAYLRFDMSEFSAEQAADRLIGAPPGYVGFEAGGELTGAVRRRPFQVVLFDEIEKAHPLVLDKFLQILEDGRLTDGQGVTTYFSECVLVFTSNLGILRTDRETGTTRRLVEPNTPYPELERSVRTEIRRHFTTELKRPELLNRFGDNIVVFDYISPDVAARICELQLDNVVTKVYVELGIELRLSPTARADLVRTCSSDLENGGRGVGNLLESNLVNPLARELFDSGAGQGDLVEVVAVHPGDDERGPTLTTRVTQGGPR